MLVQGSAGEETVAQQRDQPNDGHKGKGQRAVSNGLQGHHQAEVRAQQAEARAQQAEARAQQAEARAQLAGKHNEELHSNNTQLQTDNAQLQQENLAQIAQIEALQQETHS